MKKEIPIELLNTETDVASGQHTPTGETMWSKPTVNLSDDEESEEEIEKEAMGLLDIPTSMDGGEVLNFPGTPQNPGLSRELGDDEETDLFGADSPVDEIPPENELNKELKNLAQLLIDKQKFAEYLKLKSIIKSANNIGLKICEANDMKKRIDLLREFKKEAARQGAGVGAGLAGLSVLLPGLTFVPLPIRVMMGGIAGSMIQDYFAENPKAKTELEQQKDLVVQLQSRLEDYGVNTSELGKLSSNTLAPENLPEEMLHRGARMPTGWKEPLKKLAKQYVDATVKLTAMFEQADRVVQPAQPTPSAAPVEAPRTRTPQAYTAKGSIVRPGDPYTYDKNPSGEGYIIVSAPAGKEHTVGRVIAPGDPGYDAIREADQGSQEMAPAETTEKTPKDKAKELFIQGQEAAMVRDHAKAAELFQQSYDLYNSPTTLINLATAKYNSGNTEEAFNLFLQFKKTYPEKWNDGRSITNSMKLAVESWEKGSRPEDLAPTKEKIEAVLVKFLNGVPIRMQTPEGTATVMDSRRVRRLTNRYLRDITDQKEPSDGLSLTATGIADQYGEEIATRLKAAIERGVSPEQVSGLFNGLVWQALRKGWARWKNAPLREMPTEKSQQRREQKIERQDERSQRQVERTLRRDQAKREARRLIVKEFHKISKSK